MDTQNTKRSFVHNSMKGMMLAILGASLWGVMGIFVRGLSASGYSSYDIAFLRCLLAGIGFFLFKAITQPRVLKINFKGLCICFLYGILAYAMGFVCYGIAVERIPVAVATVLMFMSPVWVAVLGVLVFKEKLGKQTVLVILICILGAAMVADVFGSAGGSMDIIGILAGIINALKVTGKKKENCRVVVNGAGSAGIAITKLLLTYGFLHITMCDRAGILKKGMDGLNWMQEKMVEVTNLEGADGSLADAMKGADIFVGVSAPGIVTKEMAASMNTDAILFAMANPVPEIMPDAAKEAGAKIIGTGRSDFPNQVNNVVVFPGIFKGALEGRATAITEEMKLAAATAIAGLVDESILDENHILPEAFDPRVADVVSRAVKDHIQK